MSNSQNVDKIKTNSNIKSTKSILTTNENR